jgi:hypothetical protein
VKSKKPRRIVVDGRPFLWTVKHQHHVRPAGEPGEGRCREVFTAYAEGLKHGALRIVFSDGPREHAGYPEAGVVWTSGPASSTANLNTPRVAAALIRAALQQGWAPERIRTPFVIANGFELVTGLSGLLARPT